MSKYRFFIIKDYSSFLTLKFEWNELVKISSFNSIFAIHEWMDAWLQNHSKDQDRLSIIIAENSDGICAIAPMMIRKEISYGFPLNLMRFIGTPQADRCDVIIKKDEVAVVPFLVQFMREKVAGWHQLHLNEIPEESPFAKHLIKIDYPRTFIESASECPYITLTTFPTFEVLFESINRKSRLELNRKQNKMKKEGNWRVTHKLNVSIFEPEIFMARKLERQSAKAMKINDLTYLVLALPNFWNFHRSLIEKQKCFQILMSTLKRNDRLIAYCYGFIYDKSYYAYNTAFHSEYAWYSPGKIILNESIRKSIELGCHEFDFLRGASPLKKIWSKDSRQQLHIYHLNRHPINSLYIFAEFFIRPFLKRKVLPAVKKAAKRKMKNNRKWKLLSHRIFIP